MYVGWRTQMLFGLGRRQRSAQRRSSFEKCCCMLSEHFEAEPGTPDFLNCSECGWGAVHVEVKFFEALRQL